MAQFVLGVLKERWDETGEPPTLLADRPGGHGSMKNHLPRVLLDDDDVVRIVLSNAVWARSSSPIRWSRSTTTCATS